MKATKEKNLPFNDVVTLIDPRDLKPNPFQPITRIDIDAGTAKEFYLSFERSGLIHFPVVRKTEDGEWQVGDGWLRRAGYMYGLTNEKNNKYATIPCVVRTLTDEQMADLVLEANTERKDMNDLELANLYKRYLDEFGYTQETLAKKFGKSQGEISNSIRLLDLNDEVKEKIISQEISPTHGRVLLKLNNLPQMQKNFMDGAIKENSSVSELDASINRNLFIRSQPLKKGSHPEPLFDTKDCETCTFRITIADPWRSKKAEPRCLAPECWNKKQKEATKEKEAAEKKNLEKKAGKDKILSSKDIRYDQKEDLTGYTNILFEPKECEKCPKRALYSYDGTNSGVHPICTDPQCFRVKKSKKTREKNKEDKVKDQELTVRVGDIINKNGKNRLAALQLAARSLTRYLGSYHQRDLLKLVPEIPVDKDGNFDDNGLLLAIMEWTEPVLVRLIMAAIITNERRKSGTNYSTELDSHALKTISIIESRYESHGEAQKSFQIANCKGCTNAWEQMVETFEPCCRYEFMRRIDDNGVCSLSPHRKELLGDNQQPPEESQEPGEDEGTLEGDTEKAQAMVPEGVRLAENVPDEECKNCALAPTDHTVNHSFSAGHVSVKVCLKDYNALIAKEKKQNGDEEPVENTVYVDYPTLEKLAESNSCEKISSGKNVRPAVSIDGVLYLATGTVHHNGIVEVEAYKVVSPENYPEETRSYSEIDLDNPMGAYHGALVKKAKGEWVLVGPEITFKCKNKEEAPDIEEDKG